MLASQQLSRRLLRPAIQQASKAWVSTSSTDTSLIINAVGRDRVGLVSDVTAMVIDAGGNIGDSQAAKLASHFSLMMVVCLPKDKLDGLKSKLDSMKDMNVAVYEAEIEASNVTPEIAYTGKFLLEGADHPGIAHKLIAAFAKYGLSIDTMHTDQDVAPHGGTMLFRMEGIVNASAPLASGFNLEQIKDDLETLGESLNCEITLEDM